MVRKLKHHEQKLLKKVDFVHWKNADNERELQVMRKYHLQKRDDYLKYNRLCCDITKLTSMISCLSASDPYRAKISEQLLEKLFAMGIIPVKTGLKQAADITVSSICRRRLAVVMVQTKMAEYVKEAVTLIEQGHVRVGPETVTDPAFLVTRNMQDFVTWVDSSKIRRKIDKYNDTLDDFDRL